MSTSKWQLISNWLGIYLGLYFFHFSPVDSFSNNGEDTAFRKSCFKVTQLAPGTPNNILTVTATLRAPTTCQAWSALLLNHYKNLNGNCFFLILLLSPLGIIDEVAPITPRPPTKQKKTATKKDDDEDSADDEEDDEDEEDKEDNDETRKKDDTEKKKRDDEENKGESSENEDDEEEDQLTVVVKLLRWRKSNVGAFEALQLLRDSGCFIFTPRVCLSLLLTFLNFF